MSYSEDFLSIDTPENVAFGYSVAGIGSRFLAALIDTILIIVLQIIVNLVVTFFSNILVDDLFGGDAIIWIAALFGLIAFALFWGYYILFEMIWNGQSPGKRWTGLRVLRTDGTPITLVEAVIRNLVRLVDFLPFFYGVGVVTMFINDQARRLGDLAAGTLVVHDQAAVTLDSLSAVVTFGPISQVSADIEALPLERLTDQDLQLIEDYLRRRYELANSSALSQRLLQAIYKRMELPPPQLAQLDRESKAHELPD